MFACFGVATPHIPRATPLAPINYFLDPPMLEDSFIQICLHCIQFIRESDQWTLHTAIVAVQEWFLVAMTQFKMGNDWLTVHSPSQLSKKHPNRVWWWSTNWHSVLVCLTIPNNVIFIEKRRGPSTETWGTPVSD